MNLNPTGTLPARRDALRFLGWFAAIVTVYYGLTVIPWVDRHLMYPVLEFTAAGASKLLNLFGCPTTLKGVVIQGSDYAVAVRRGCDPLEPIMLFCAAIVAFPSVWRPKLWGMTVGGTFLYSLNLARIASLYLLGRRQSAWFYSLHQEWWPALYIVSAILVWLVWLRWQQTTGRQQYD
jgi:exosortase H (IPTLxxWG-CTERM-specific)